MKAALLALIPLLLVSTSSALHLPPTRMSARAGTSSGVQTGQSGWFQKTITVQAPSRGCHLITSDIVKQVPELREFTVGMANVFIRHTSASLTINENADSDVRSDMEKALNQIVPETWHSTMFDHTLEGYVSSLGGLLRDSRDL